MRGESCVARKAVLQPTAFALPSSNFFSKAACRSHAMRDARCAMRVVVDCALRQAAASQWMIATGLEVSEKQPDNARL